MQSYYIEMFNLKKSFFSGLKKTLFHVIMQTTLVHDFSFIALAKDWDILNTQLKFPSHFLLSLHCLVEYNVSQFWLKFYIWEFICKWCVNGGLLGWQPYDTGVEEKAISYVYTWR